MEGRVEMIDFIRDSDALILDSQYTAAEYKQHVSFGGMDAWTIQ